MTRALPTFAFLLIAACNKPEDQPPVTSNGAVAEAAAPAVVPSLEGEWRVTKIDGRDAAGAGMSAAFGSGKASIATGCLRRAWTYTQKRNTVAFSANPAGSSNCGQAPSGNEETAYAALGEANIAIFARQGAEASLSGTGGTLTLERR